MLGVVALAFIIWATLLVRMVASSPSAPRPTVTPPCHFDPRVMWAPRVILGREEAAAAVHINAEGRIAAAWPCTKDEATAYAQVRSLAIE